MIHKFLGEEICQFGLLHQFRLNHFPQVANGVSFGSILKTDTNQITLLVISVKVEYLALLNPLIVITISLSPDPVGDIPFHQMKSDGVLMPNMSNLSGCVTMTFNQKKMSPISMFNKRRVQMSNHDPYAERYEKIRNHYPKGKDTILPWEELTDEKKASLIEYFDKLDSDKAKQAEINQSA